MIACFLLAYGKIKKGEMTVGDFVVFQIYI